MTIAYYHGSPGSYKTSSMIADWYVPALASGRKVLTNIRGIQPAPNVTVVSSSQIVDAMFHVDRGSLILIDELGECFTDIDFKKWRAPSSSLVSSENGVDVTVDKLSTLFDKHRHFNLDIIGTAPGIKRVPADFMAVAEFGYKHKALQSLGLGAYFIQGQHNGFDKGENDKDFISKRIKKIPKSVFGLYASTATGKTQGSAVSSPLWRHPVILGLSLFIGYGIYSVATHKGATGIIAVKPSDSAGQAVNSGTPVTPSSAAPVVSSVAMVTPAPVALVAAVADPQIVVMGYISMGSRKAYIVGNCDIQRRIDFPPGVPTVDGFTLQGDNLRYRGLDVPNYHTPCPDDSITPYDSPSLVSGMGSASSSLVLN